MRISLNTGRLTCVRESVGVASTLISLCVLLEEEEVEKSGRRAGQQTGWLAGQR